MLRTIAIALLLVSHGVFADKTFENQHEIIAEVSQSVYRDSDLGDRGFSEAFNMAKEKADLLVDAFVTQSVLIKNDEIKTSVIKRTKSLLSNADVVSVEKMQDGGGYRFDYTFEFRYDKNVTKAVYAEDQKDFEKKYGYLDSDDKEIRVKKFYAGLWDLLNNSLTVGEPVARKSALEGFYNVSFTCDIPYQKKLEIQSFIENSLYRFVLEPSKIKNRRDLVLLDGNDYLFKKRLTLKIQLANREASFPLFKRVEENGTSYLRFNFIEWRDMNKCLRFKEYYSGEIEISNEFKRCVATSLGRIHGCSLMAQGVSKKGLTQEIDYWIE